MASTATANSQSAYESIRDPKNPSIRRLLLIEEQLEKNWRLNFPSTSNKARLSHFERFPVELQFFQKAVLEFCLMTPRELFVRDRNIRCVLKVGKRLLKRSAADVRRKEEKGGKAKKNDHKAKGNDSGDSGSADSKDEEEKEELIKSTLAKLNKLLLIAEHLKSAPRRLKRKSKYFSLPPSSHHWNVEIDRLIDIFMRINSQLTIQPTKLVLSSDTITRSLEDVEQLWKKSQGEINCAAVVAYIKAEEEKMMKKMKKKQ
ncbi:hypothetical protein TYRP_001717 [Tyrophagus putrescentiae]|nr:hypothetical protein TYRP_001717 [Tyrophagus putrescentiae]